MELNKKKFAMALGKNLMNKAKDSKNVKKLKIVFAKSLKNKKY